MTKCIHLATTSAYFDHALPEADWPRALVHIESCEQCQGLLLDAATLDAVIASERSASRVTQRAVRRRRSAPVAVAMIAAAAAIALWLARRDDPRDIEVALMLSHDRAIEARFSGARFAPHRPLATVRGDHASEALSLAQLAQLEAQGDRRDLIAALAAAGDLVRARSLSEQPRDPAGDSDRAAIEIAGGSPEEALMYAYRAVDRAPELAAGWWNLALAARDRHLERVARAALDKVVARGEPGWAEEARLDIAALDRDIAVQLDFAGFEQRARAMAAGGPPITIAEVRRFATYARAYVLDAIRTRSGAALDPLRPLAAELDIIAAAPTMTAAIDRAAAALPATRAPFAAEYRAVINATASQSQIAALLVRLRAAGPAVDDLRAGVLVRAGQSTRGADELREITATWHDPWFDRLVDLETVRATWPVDDVRAEPALVAALSRCTGDVWALRCGQIAYELADRLVRWGRDHDAEPWCRLAVDRFRVAGAVPYLHAARAKLAGIHRRLGRNGIARAELEELVLADTGCDWTRFAKIGLAELALLRDDLVAMRAALPPASAPAGCAGGPDPLGLTAAVDLARQTRDPQDLARAQQWIAAQRDQLDRGLAAVGTLRIAEADDATATQTVRDWIAAHVDSRDPSIVGVRAWGTSALISAAGGRADWAGVIASSAAEHATEITAPCVFAATYDDGTLTVALRTATVLLGEQRRVAPGELGAAKIASPAMIAALERCAEIAALARPPLHGNSGLLPASLRWAFAGDTPKHAGALGGAHAVDVSDVRPPDANLPRLSTPRSTQAFDVVLTGVDATPSRVVAALATATYVELHVHGVAAASNDEATYLALSAEHNGDYALRARDVRSAKLERAPIVVLAACRAAAVGPLLRERWSLPDAFLAAGASAVVAADVEIPELTARRVFDELHRRIAAGEAVATAVAAIRATAAGDTAWATHLMVFR